MLAPFVAQEMGRQTRHGFTEDTPRVKFSFGKDQGYRLFLYKDAVPRRSPLQVSLRNQQMFLGIFQYPDFEERASWFN